MHANKTARKNATFYERAKLALDESRDIPVTLPLAGEERFQISRNDSIKQILFRMTRPVDVLDCHEDIAEAICCSGV